jgi:hypothetical protein
MYSTECLVSDMVCSVVVTCFFLLLFLLRFQQSDAEQLGVVVMLGTSTFERCPVWMLAGPPVVVITEGGIYIYCFHADVRYHLVRWVLLSSSYTKSAVNTIVGDTRADRRGGILEGCLGSIYVAYIFVFLGYSIIYRLFKLSLSDQVHVILQLRVGPFRLSVKIFSSSTHAVEPKKFFHCGLKSLFGSPGWL